MEKLLEEKLVVSEKHKVYSSSKNLFSSLVLNTGSSDCSLKCLSLDQIGMLSSSANAKNETSFLSEINRDAFDLNSSEGDINSMILGRSDSLCSSSSLVISDLKQMVLEYLLSSLNNSLGENNSTEYEFISSLVYDSALNKDRTTLVSTTNFIYGLLFSDDSSMLSFNLFPNSMQSSSVSLEFSNPSLNFSNASSCFILLANASLAIEDQLSHSNLSILCLNSFGTDNVSDGMFMSYTYDTCDMCYHTYQVYKDFDLEQVTGGKEVYFLNSDDESVKFESITKEDCDGEEIDLFVIWEDDLIGDDSVNENPASISFSDGKAVSSWTVEYQDDFFGNPEYYFVSSLKSDADVRIDSRDYGELLRVTKAGNNMIGGCPNYVWTGIR